MNIFRLSRDKQRGQALAEFLIVGIFVLVPLFLIVPVVAKVISIDQDVEIAARYAAWERTAWYSRDDLAHLREFSGPINYKTRQDVASEIDPRVLAHDTQPIISDSAAGYELDPFLHRQNGVLDPLLKNLVQDSNDPPMYAALRETESEPSGDLAGKMTATVGSLDGFTNFRLNKKGQGRATVMIELMDLSDVFGPNLGVDAITLSSTNVLLAESWAAGGREHAQYLISGLLPTQYFENNVVSGAQDAMGGSFLSKELDDDCLRFGHTDIEPIPAHRLGPKVGQKGELGYSCDMD